MIGSFDNFINRGCDIFAKGLVMPLYAKGVYWSSKKILRTVEVVNPALKGALEECWYHPFSSSLLLKFFDVLERNLLSLATRKPVQVRGLHFFDRSFIAISQSLCNYTVVIASAYRLPHKIKEFIKTLSIESVVEHVSNYLGKDFNTINWAVIQLKKFGLFILDAVIKVADFLSQFIFTYQIEIFSYLREVVEDTRNDIQARFAAVAICAVKKREVIIRGKLFSALHQWFTTQIVVKTTRIAVKALFLVPVYLAIQNVYPEKAYVLPVLALGAAMVYSKKFLDPYYKTYEKNFDPYSSEHKEIYKKLKMRRQQPQITHLAWFFNKSKK